MNLSVFLLSIILLILLLIVVDFVIRAFFIHKVSKTIYQRGDYRIRKQTLGHSKKQIAITLLGDSVIYGEGSDVPISLVGSVIDNFIRNGYQVKLHNLAVTGHTVGDVAKKQVPLLEKSDLIFVYVGGNNYFQFHSINSYREQLFELGESLRNKNVVWFTIGDPRFLWLLPIWLRWIFYFRAKTFSKLLKDMVAKNTSENWCLIDLFTLAFAKMRQQKKNPKQLLSDGFHLSHEGQTFLNKLIGDEFKKLKNKKNSTLFSIEFI